MCVLIFQGEDLSTLNSTVELEVTKCVVSICDEIRNQYSTTLEHDEEIMRSCNMSLLEKEQANSTSVGACGPSLELSMMQMNQLLLRIGEKKIIRDVKNAFLNKLN